ncbi:MAG: winged helix-turn-helix domain-containing protein [Myxococcota bacterium]
MVRLVDGMVDLETGVIRRDGGITTLSTRERRLLAALVDAAGAPLSRDALTDEGEGPRTVDFAIRRLRQKLELDPRAPRHLLTVHGEGYCFEPAVETRRTAPEPVTKAAGHGPRLGPWQLLASGRRLTDGQHEVDLTHKEAAVLASLLAREGDPVDRATLIEEAWDLPRPELERYVDPVVHRLRQKLEPVPDQPVLIKGVRGTGYRVDLLWGETHLPNAPEPLWGRQADCAALDATLKPRGVVTGFVGPAGIGKTALVAHYLASVSDRYREVWHVDLQAVDHPEGVAQALATRLAVPLVRDEPPSVLVDRLVEVATTRAPLVLWLDHGDDAVVATLGLAGRLAQAARVIVTLRMVPLQAPHAQRLLSLAPLSPESARAAFVGLAHASEDDPRLDNWIRRTDRLPLAIQLAARTFAVAPELAPRIDGMDALLRWTVDRLSPDERRGFLASQAWPGGFETARWSAVAWPDAPGTAAQVLVQLTERGLVGAREGGGWLPQHRFRSWLEAHPPEDFQTFQDAVSVELAEAAMAQWRRFHDVGDADARRWLVRERLNLEAYQARALANDRPEAAALTLGLCLSREYDGPLLGEGEANGWLAWLQGRTAMRRGRLGDAETQLRALTHDPEAPWAMDALNTLGFVLAQKGHIDDAVACVDRGLELAGRDSLRRAALLSTRGSILTHFPDTHDAGIRSLLEALASARLHRDEYEVARILNNLGNVRMRQMRYDEARTHHEAALEVREQLGQTFDHASSLVNLMSLEMRTANHAAARRRAEQALNLALRHGAREVEATARSNLAMVEAHAKHFLDAEVLARQACTLSEVAGFTQQIANNASLLALLAATDGRLDEALSEIQKSIVAYESLSMGRWTGRMHAMEACIRHLRNEPKAAAEALEKAPDRLPPRPASNPSVLLGAQRWIAGLPPDEAPPEAHRWDLVVIWTWTQGWTASLP